MIPAKNTPYFTGTGNNDMRNMAGADIEFDITYITQPFAISTIYNFLFPKLTNAHIITPE
jgi:hypothetical protein